MGRKLRCGSAVPVALVLGEDGSIYFLSQGHLVSVGAYFSPKVDGQREKLIALAEHALERL